MIEDSIPQLPVFPQVRLHTRSMGIKLIVVCFLALMMTIPSFFVDSLVSERTKRQSDVTNEISALVGGPETFLGPTLAIPYTIAPRTPAEQTRHGIYIVFPAQGSADIKTTTEERHRSLFRVPVFQAGLNFDALFDLTGVPANAPTDATLDWSRAELIVGVSDPRGALADATLATEGQPAQALVPAQIAEHFNPGPGVDEHARLTLFGSRAGDIAKPGTHFRVTATLRFSGAQRLAMLAYGKTTRIAAQGDWPNPGFDGGILPTSRTIYNNGYSANWTVPFIARGVRAEGPAESITGLNATAPGVSFISVADPYQSVNRSLKYVLLFLGLVFLSYFVFEVTTGKRVHPAQYILVGMAQLIFYLLLLSLAERIGFDLGFLIAGTATVALLASNAGWIFASRLEGLRALGVFSLLYTFIYLLLRLEDNALLLGAIASFLTVAAVMYLTRRIDWYSPLGSGGRQPSSSVPPPHPLSS